MSKTQKNFYQAFLQQGFGLQLLDVEFTYAKQQKKLGLAMQR